MSDVSLATSRQNSFQSRRLLVCLVESKPGFLRWSLRHSRGLRPGRNPGETSPTLSTLSINNKNNNRAPSTTNHDEATTQQQVPSISPLYPLKSWRPPPSRQAIYDVPCGIIVTGLALSTSSRPKSYHQNSQEPKHPRINPAR